MRYLFKLLPFFLQSLLGNLLFKIRSPSLVSAKENYLFSDEDLKFIHILESVNYLKIAGIEGAIPHVYFEFGCHSGRTFSEAVKASKFLDIEDMEFFAFDSFSGLPDTDPNKDGVFKKGDFFTSKKDFIKIVKKKSRLELEEHQIIEGFFSETLNAELQNKLPKAGIVHIDVDLYSSTVEILNFIKPLLSLGTVILFDDWYCFPVGEDKGERLALKEFCKANPKFQLEEWKNYSTFGKSFFVSSLP